MGRSDLQERAGGVGLTRGMARGMVRVVAKGVVADRDSRSHRYNFEEWDNRLGSL